MNKFAYLKCVEKKEDIPIKSKFTKILPQYFKDKYIIKNNPLVINEIEYLNIEGYEIILPLLSDEIGTVKSNIIIEDTLYKLEEMKVTALSTDIKLPDFGIKIIHMSGNNLLKFFIFPAIKRILKFTQKDIKYTEILIIDNDDENSTYNIIDAIYQEVNYLTVFTGRPEYFCEYVEKIYSDTGLNLQIIEQNKSAIKQADIIINLSSSNEFNFDYFYKKGSIYFDLSNNTDKTVELLRKRQDINIIDNLIINYNTNNIKNSKLEAVLYIKYNDFENFINYNTPIDNKDIIDEIIKNNDLNIIAFCQYGSIIKQYKS